MKNIKLMSKHILVATLSVVLFALSTSMSARAENYIFNNNLIMGQSGSEVTLMQKWLMANGFEIQSIKTGVATYGYFGKETRGALMSYQRVSGLPATGFFGPLTRAKLNSTGAAQTPVGQTGQLKVVSPNGGESWQRGTAHEIVWNSPVYVRATNVDINLIPKPACNGEVCLMIYAMPYNIVRGISAEARSFKWNVGDASYECAANPTLSCVGDKKVYAPAGQYYIEICESGTTVCARSTNLFSIVER